MRIARCPFVSHIGHFGYVSPNDLRGASRTTGPKSRHAFRTGLGRGLRRPHRSETRSLQRAPRLRTTRSGGSPEPIGILGNLRPQVAKLRTLGTVVLAGRNGGFFSLAKPGTGHFQTIGRFSNHYKPSLRQGNRLSWGASVLTPVHVVWASSKRVRNWLTILGGCQRPGCRG